MTCRHTFWVIRLRSCKVGDVDAPACGGHCRGTRPRAHSPDSNLFIDTRIQEDVLAALRQDPRIKHPELLAASVDEIGTVALRGAVESLPERLAAAHDTRHVDGVFDVIVDDVKVHPPLAHRRADDEIRAAALERLTADARIRSTSRFPAAA